MADPNQARQAVLALGLGVFALVVGLLAIGGPTGPIAGIDEIMVVRFRGLALAWLTAGVAASAMLASAMGLGWLACRAIGLAKPGLAIAAGVGVGLTMTISQLIGTLGLLEPAFAIGSLVPGWIGLLLAWRACNRTDSKREPGRMWAWTWAPGLCLLAVASASGPGWLWDTEFGGYDSLSYHLQLPQEWLALGRIVPVEHNVYSALPSGIEAMFVHLAAATLAPSRPAGGELFAGLLAGSAWRMVACQMLHAGMLVLAAAALRELALRVCDSVDAIDPRTRSAIGWLVGAVVLATPWAIVVGSLSYNEAGVILLAASALLVAIGKDGGAVRWPVRRSVLAGALVGLACGFKPTAILFVAPAVGLSLLASMPAKRWLSAVLVGSVAGSVSGVVVMLPWLVRNWIELGSPVFPQASGLFGSAHWTGEQASRYASAHFGEGLAGLGHALSLERGLLHPQWLALWPAVFVAGVLVVLLSRTASSRRLAWPIAAGLVVQLLAWALVTHVQSRFVLPMLPMAMVLVAFAAARLGRAGVVALSVLVAVQAIGAVVIFAGQRDGRPNMMLSLSPHAATGKEVLALEPITEVGRDQQLELLRLTPTRWINAFVPRGETVYLLGTATPLFVRTPVVYHTTWDESPMGGLIREHPDEPERWTAGLLARGISWVWIDEGELERLGPRSGWYDPAVTPEAVARWQRTLGEPAWAWPRLRSVVYRLE